MRWIENPCVGGSIPPQATKFKANCMQLALSFLVPLGKPATALMRWMFSLITAAVLSACAIQQTVTPVPAVSDARICVVENMSVRVSFLTQYMRALRKKGYTVEKLAPNAALDACPTVTTYAARWRFDLVHYMEFADLTVYQQGKSSGRATYDSAKGQLHRGKFVDIDAKLAELVEQLLPAPSDTASPQ